MNTTKNQPSKQSQIILNSLKQATNNVLEKKRRLGQYVVLWENDAIVYKGEDAPSQEKG